jgi:hypothetical protein
MVVSLLLSTNPFENLPTRSEASSLTLFTTVQKINYPFQCCGFPTGVFLLAILLALFTLLNGPKMLYAAETVYDDSAWASVLETYVDNQGYVDYPSLNRNREMLNRYLTIVRNSGPETTPNQFPTREHELAYYINAYNVLVFNGVLARGPETESVWSGLISGLNFFVRMDIELDGQITNLRNLENKVIRDKFKDPRIHAALNCASVSCPRLPREPFTPGNLDQQLESSMMEFAGNTNNVRVDTLNSTVYLSEIFDWFDKDFLEYEQSQNNNSGSLLDYINRYRAIDQKIDTGFKIRFIDYNKALNSISN